MTTGCSTTTDLHTAQRPQNCTKTVAAWVLLSTSNSLESHLKHWLHHHSDSQIRSCVNSCKEVMTHRPQVLLANLETEVPVQPSAAVLDTKRASASTSLTLPFGMEDCWNQRHQRCLQQYIQPQNKKYVQGFHQTHPEDCKSVPRQISDTLKL